MHLFRHDNPILFTIPEKPFKLEKELQDVVEINLETLMGLQLVKSEFTIKNRRIDTLAFDTESKAFVIIEYKRSRNFSVVDQGMAYLNLMLDNKAEFIVEYNESLKASMKRSEVDWSQTRLVFVSNGFTQNQKEAINFRDFNIELCEVRRFEGDIINVVWHKASNAAPSFKEVASTDEQAREIRNELKTYLEEDHLARGSEQTAELYEALKAAVLNFGSDVEMKPKKMVIGFKAGRIFCDVHIQKKGLKLWVNLKKGELDDARKLARDVSSVGHWGNGDYEITMEDDSQLEYTLSLVKQAYLITRDTK